MNHKSQRGEGRLGCVIWTLVLLAGAYAAYIYIPKRIAVAEFQDYISEQAKFASAETRGDALEKAVFKKAQELQLPVDRKNIVVEKGRQRVRYHVTYTIRLDFPFFPYDWHVEHDEAREIFTF